MQGYVVPAIIGTMTSSDFSHHIASDFPLRGYTSATRAYILGFFFPTEMMRDLPSSYRYCGNIPLPLRRGRATQHFQILYVAYGLHPRGSGSAFLLLCDYDAAVFTSCYGLLPCSPRLGLHTASALESLPVPGICYMAFWRYHGRTYTCKHL